MEESVKWETRFRRAHQGFWAALSVGLAVLAFAVFTLWGDMHGNANRAAAWQALGSFMAILPVVVTIWIAAVASLRAEKAEAESVVLRAASVDQAQAMARMAAAAEEQTGHFRAEWEQARKLQLMIAAVPKGGTVVNDSGGKLDQSSSYHLTNFSAFPVMVESIRLLSSKGGDTHVTLALDNDSVRGMGAMLQPGEYRHLDLWEPWRALQLAGQASLEYGLTVVCLSPGHGRQEVSFTLRFANWKPDAPLEIEQVSVVAVHR